ncbi:unnamed protein product [Blepharisma stoltei]|uniref:PNPLA domain-containing protein n=1 Tax=Blepharisma stoltei TaxID=1481888 RepID=A0AAU9JXF7_9CILI|nr:unnamed protein product [Blepharisma stoltei]
MWLLVLVNFILTSQVLGINGKCRILALGGNSDKGAYEAGAINGLFSNLPAGEFSYDVVTGNGVGAWNAFLLAQWAVGNEAQAGAAINQFWLNFNKTKFYKEWAGGEAQGILLEHGLYDARPLEQSIKYYSNGSYKRWTGVGATDLLSGNYVFFNSSKLSLETMNLGVRASMAQQGTFPYIEFNNLELITGSVKFSVDILSGINACEELGYGQQNMIVDVILCSGKKLATINASKYTTIKVLKRTYEVQDYLDTMKIVVNSPLDYPDITVRTVTYPSQAIPESDVPYDFTPSELQSMITLGTQDAQSALKVSYLYN